MSKVVFKNITYRYGNHTVIENFNLEIEDGKIMGIVGPSGCGKTTLARCLCGFIKPEKGEIYIGDRCVFSTEKRINIAPERRNVGVVFQDYAVWPHMSVWDNVTYPMRKKKINKETIQKRAEHALKQVRMTGYAKHMPAQLSGGQQQRVAIARALVSSEDLIIMDEPITNLDAKLRDEMMVEIANIQSERGATILYITHDQETALQLCDTVAILEKDGSLVQVGTDEGIIKSPSNRYVFEFIGLSNFVPLKIQNNAMYIDNGALVPFLDKLPKNIDAKGQYEVGVRPMNIVFNDSSPLKGVIESATFLGNQYNYFIKIANQRLRVQKNSQDADCLRGYGEGDTVGLEFKEYFIYPKKEVQA